jgi:hypothetical protein
VDYYEELGLTPKASPEEVREAWRGLVRLLHPDQQQDARLRRLAECQMKRLNEIHNVLTDPVRRRRYDLTMAAEDGDRYALAIVEGPRGARREIRACWPIAGAVAAVFVTWIVATSSAPRPASLTPRQKSSPSAVANPPTVPQAAQAARSRNRRERRVAPRPGIVPFAQVKAPANRPALPARLPEATPSPAISPVAPAAPGPSPQAISPAVPASSPFTGAWVYVPPRLAVSESSLYPPEFIETVILDEGGFLRGRYRARYRITDRPISPEVRFQFAGKPSGDRALLTWNGPGGSKGEIQLHLLKPDVMELRWVASDLGSQLGLASGTAVLVRRFEP